MTNISDDLRKELREVGNNLHLLETVPVYFDGGASIGKIQERITSASKRLDKIASQLPLTH